MKLNILTGFLYILLLISYIDGRKSSSSSSRRSGSSSGSRYSTRTTSRPRQQSGNSSPGTYGWNVPPKQSQPINTKASAPSETISKSSATNVQSSWKPSGGYNSQTGTPYANSGQSNRQHNLNHGYNPSVGSNQHNLHQNTHYNPSQSQNNPGSYNGYNSPGYYPSPGMNSGYHPSPGMNNGYHPSYNQPHQPYNPYNPSYGHSYTPGTGYNPPVGHAPQTILVQSAGQSSRPGIGQLAKEALVFAGVSAGVNAVANRIIPGGIYGGHGYSSHPATAGNAAVPPVTHTQITYNNYYNNGSIPENPVAPAVAQAPVAAAPAQASATPPPIVPLETDSNLRNNSDVPNTEPAIVTPKNEDEMFPSPLGSIITKNDVEKLTEDLFEKDTNNAFKFITMNLQGQKMDDSTKDDASEPLLTVKAEAYEIPTIKTIIALHDNYDLDIKVKEVVTSEERKEESDFIDAILETDVMKTTMKFLAEKGYVPNDEYEFKDILKRIWFSQFKRIDGEPGSSGFETVFLAEKFDAEIIGMHNWIYYAKREEDKKLNYLGYIKQTPLGDKGAIIKLRSSLEDTVQPITTIFVGTSPELEIALYTMCFYTRPNYACPIKLANQNFIIIANRVNYFGKDILISAYPEI
ncbi:endoribonuclease CG2145-like isoform X1 [Microplitis demolitor]|uniref:endoribonuclease CG2145-like isoform X1 n=1 Tax=Microplitis demolitor TaxID=69319 RepID=UPI0004CD11AD|nr:endoribonuclease CG2145-like isoform X1 [Microplitis demolitor]